MEISQEVVTAVASPVPDKSLSHFVSIYLAMGPATGRSVHTQGAKGNDLRIFVEWYEKTKQTGDISKWFRADTSRFLDWASGRWGAATINRRLATLRHFARFCSKVGGLNHDPIGRIADLPYEPKAPAMLTQAQLSALRAAADALVETRSHAHAMPVRDRAILWVLSQTGMRVASLCALDLNQLDGSQLRSVRGKGTQKLDHYLPQQARKALQDWLDIRGGEPGPLFWSFSRKSLDRSDVAEQLRLMARKANFELPKDEKIRVTPGMFRHTVAQELCNKHGASFAAEKLGHTSSRYIKRYLKRAPELDEQMIEAALAVTG